MYRPDLPQYAIPDNRKRKLTGIIDEPQAKIQKTTRPPNVVHDKRSRPSDSKDDGCPKKPPVVNNSGNNCNNNARVQIALLMKLNLHLGHQPLFVMTQAELGPTLYTNHLELTGEEKRVRNWVYAFMLTMV